MELVGATKMFITKYRKSLLIAVVGCSFLVLATNFWISKNRRCGLSFDGEHVLAWYFDSEGEESSFSRATIQEFQLNGQLVDEFSATELKQYYPPTRRRFKILDPKIDSGSVVPYVHGRTFLQKCSGSLRLIDSPVELSETGGLWMMPDYRLLVIESTQIKLYDNLTNGVELVLVNSEVRPLNGNAELTLQTRWVFEPTERHILLIESYKITNDSYRSFAELYTISENDLSLIVSWQILANTISTSQDSSIVYLSQDGTQLVHRDVGTGDITQRLKLPRTVPEADVVYYLNPRRNALILEDYDAETKTRHDLFNLTVLPSVVPESLSPDLNRKNPTFVFWDRHRQIAWYWLKSKLIGAHKNGRTNTTIDCGFNIESAEYSQSLNSIVVLGSKPPNWKVFDVSELK